MKLPIADKIRLACAKAQMLRHPEHPRKRGAFKSVDPRPCCVVARIREVTQTLAEWLRSDDAPRDDPAARAAAKLALRRFYAAIVRRDMAALAETLTEDALYEFPLSESGSSDPADCRRFVGRDAVVAFWQETSALDMRFAPPEDVTLSILADGSRLFLEQRGDITLPSGFAYRNRYIFRYDFRDGQICKVREYLNPVISAIAFGRALAGQAITG